VFFMSNKLYTKKADVTFFFLFTFLIGNSTIQAELTNQKTNSANPKEPIIVEMVKYTHSIVQEAAKYDVVLLDIDDVVLTANQYLCGYQWWSRHRKNNTMHYKIDGKKVSFTNLYDDYCTTDYKAVSKELNKGFSELAKKTLVLGFTNKPMDNANKILKSVNKVGMSFTTTPINHKNIKDGIIFVGRTKDGISKNKGEFLQKMIDDRIFDDVLGKKVSRVFFVDDTIGKLRDVEKSLSNNIVFKGIHFTKAASDLQNLLIKNGLPTTPQPLYHKTLDKIIEYQTFIAAISRNIPSDQEAIDFIKENNL
jgi:hypothetical protein